VTVRAAKAASDTVRKQAGDATGRVAPGFARMTSHTESHWVVLKFGGTSVSSVSNWKNIAAVIRERLAEGLHPVVVHSALSGITDRLE
jgi:hypothetical protein